MMGELGVIEYLYVRFPDKRNYQIPARFIAEDRAKYYAKLDSEKEGASSALSALSAFQRVFESEVEFALGDSFELLDWANNNMNWSDVQGVAKLFEQPELDLNREWTKAYKWVEYEQPKQTDADKAMEELFDL